MYLQLRKKWQHQRQSRGKRSVVTDVTSEDLHIWLSSELYENNLYLKLHNTGNLNNSALQKCQQCCNFPIIHLLTIQFTKTIPAILRSNIYMLSLLPASHALSYIHTIPI